MLEEVKKQIADGKRVLIAVPNTGEVERLADVFSEYAVSFRLGSRTRSGMRTITPWSRSTLPTSDFIR